MAWPQEYTAVASGLRREGDGRGTPAEVRVRTGQDNQWAHCGWYYSTYVQTNQYACSMVIKYSSALPCSTVLFTTMCPQWPEWGSDGSPGNRQDAQSHTLRYASGWQQGGPWRLLMGPGPKEDRPLDRHRPPAHPSRLSVRSQPGGWLVLRGAKVPHVPSQGRYIAFFFT